MNQRTAWSWAWAIWLALTAGSFAVLETLALRRRCLPTLSWTLARWFGCNPRHRRGPFALTAFAAMWVWLTVHVARYQHPTRN